MSGDCAWHLHEGNSTTVHIFVHSVNSLPLSVMVYCCHTCAPGFVNADAKGIHRVFVKYLNVFI